MTIDEKLKERLLLDWPTVHVELFNDWQAGDYTAYIRCSRYNGTTSEHYAYYLPLPFTAEKAMEVEEWFRSKL